MKTFPHIRELNERRDGQPVRALLVRCSVCDEEKRTIRCSLDIVARVLTDHGWDNPRDPKRAACPECVAKRKAEAVKAKEDEEKRQLTPAQKRAAYLRIEASKKPEAVMKTTATQQTPSSKVIEIKVAAEAPRAASREDNRRIREALDATYDELRGCYTGNFSDDSLAAQLDVPRAWVSSVRDQFYGPNTSAERLEAPAKLAEYESEARRLMDDSMAIAARAETLMRDVAAMKALLGV